MSSPEMTESAAALEAREVWKAFERTQALSGVSFALSAGGVHALVGAMGGQIDLLGNRLGPPYRRPLMILGVVLLGFR